MIDDPADVTLAAYEGAAELYLTSSRHPPPTVLAHLDRFAELLRGEGVVLEIGSGPGWDANHLEKRGLQVLRTDATRAFVDRLRGHGFDARRLDARTEELGGPYSGLVANAVLLHLSRSQFEAFLRRARAAVCEDGALAFTLKEGDGDGWSDHKLGGARHFTYWRADQVNQLLARTGWNLVRLDPVSGYANPWLHYLAQRGT